ncbi:MAG: AAA family ATPase [Acidimicrobiales bacterium]
MERHVAGVGDRITLIGVDGHSAAGKSTFAARLAERLDASLVRGDDFYRVMDAAERARLTPEEGMRSYYDW